MANYSFSGHESFACKSLWLKKGYDFVMQKRDFNAPDAAICLAVIKNMDSSIRYWLKVCDIYDNGEITPLGYYLFDTFNAVVLFLSNMQVHLNNHLVYKFHFGELKEA